ncbi:hypothetical protein TNCV_2697751 [Trichonephila clavipes]|nr:hypothetical protein TNCV_2697751 [Trichonephila clavipes]
MVVDSNPRTTAEFAVQGMMHVKSFEAQSPPVAEVRVLKVAKWLWSRTQGQRFRDAGSSPDTIKDLPCRVMHVKSVVAQVAAVALLVKVTNWWPTCHEFEPYTPEDPPCREPMHVKSVESSNILLLVWYGS